MATGGFLRAAVVIASLVLSAGAFGEEMGDIVRRAIQDGHATGTVTGAVAQAVSSGTKGTGDVMAKIVAVGAFQNPECKRLQVTVSQHGVPTLQGPRTTVVLPTTELNMCLDGTPPDESRTPENIAKNLDRLKGQILQVDPNASRSFAR